MNHPTKKGIRIIERMLKVDKRVEEDTQFIKLPPCKVIYGESVVSKFLRDVNRGARMPGSLFRGMVRNTPMEVMKSETFKKEDK